MRIDRPRARGVLATALERSRVVALIGPRQCGKTTLAREFVSSDSVNYFDLEDPLSLARLDEPMTALRDLRGLVVIDEVQRRPSLYPVLRVLVDRDDLPARFLILGSAAPDMLRQPSESLAGRLETVELSCLGLEEVGWSAHAQHWRRGGFPLSFVAATDDDSLSWRRAFMRTFIERDVPQFGVGAAPAQLRRFWAMVGHYHGQTWNSAEPARSLGISESTVRRYLDILESVLMVRALPPWHANTLKRQVKSPKVYIRDSGLLHALLGVGTAKELLEHAKSGASWEGYVIEEILKYVQPDEAYFWATHAGAELDLLLLKDGYRIGVECKRIDAPRASRSMHVAMHDLKLDRLVVIYPGPQPYQLADGIEVLPVETLAEGMPWRELLGLTRREPRDDST